MFCRITLTFSLFLFLYFYVVGQEVIAHYPFDGTLEDVQNGYDGEALGVLVYEPFYSNEGLRILDEGYNGVFIPYEVMDDAHDFTVCAFIKLNGYNSNNNLLSAASYNLDNEFIIGYNLLPDALPNGWHFVIHSEKYFFENSDFMTAGKRYHIAFVRDGNTARLIVNGSALVDEVAVTSQQLHISPGGLLVGQDQDCLGGCFQPNQNLDGLIDDLIFFKEALTIEEINQHCIEMTVDVSEESVLQEASFNVFPNPFEQVFWIEGTGERMPHSFELFSLWGVHAFSGVLEGDSSVSVSADLPVGTYVLVVKDKDGLPMGVKLLQKF